MLIYNIHKRNDEVIFVSVGANIKQRRYELRMSQQELADAMGYKTRSTIAKIESGENDVSQKKLQKFAAVLHTTVEMLITGVPSRPEAVAPVELTVGKRHKNIAVILAGGKTGQNRQNIPAQFVNVHGKPIIVYGMDAYQSHPSVDEIYVVCLKGWENIVKAYADQYGITKLKGLIPGGNSGIASLKNAVEYLQRQCAPDDLIIIQEATRPRVTADTISNLLLACADKGSATICHSMHEYVQFRVRDGKAQYVDRDAMIALQSPEAHRLSLLTQMFAKAQTQRLPLTQSCCTMLLHELGYDINFIQSNINNIKMVRDEDLAAFGALVKG